MEKGYGTIENGKDGRKRGRKGVRFYEKFIFIG